MPCIRSFCAASLTGVLLVLSGCAGSEGAASLETDWPHGTSDLVLRMQTLPGMAPPHVGQVPDFVMYGDGTVVVPGSDRTDRTLAHLDDATVGALLDSAVALVDSGEASGAAGPDAPVVNLSFIRDGARDQASLDGTDARVAELRQQVLDEVADAQP